MGNLFWAKRFLQVALAAFAVLALVYLGKGRPVSQALSEAFVWGVISSAIFIAVRIYRSRRGQHCGYCNDIPGGESAGQCQR